MTPTSEDTSIPLGDSVSIDGPTGPGANDGSESVDSNKSKLPLGLLILIVVVAVIVLIIALCMCLRLYCNNATDPQKSIVVPMRSGYAQRGGIHSVYTDPAGPGRPYKEGPSAVVAWGTDAYGNSVPYDHTLSLPGQYDTEASETTL